MILAITRIDAANYLNALLWIYTVMILARILLTWAVMVPSVVRMLQNPALRGIVGFVEDITDPYLNLWRRMIPPLRTGSGLIDVSPVIALIALQLVGGIIIRLIHG